MLGKRLQIKWVRRIRQSALNIAFFYWRHANVYKIGLNLELKTKIHSNCKMIYQETKKMRGYSSEYLILESESFEHDSSDVLVASYSS